MLFGFWFEGAAWMFAVEIYAPVRRFVFVEGHSRREAARIFEVNRDVVVEIGGYSAPPGYVRMTTPARSRLGSLVPVVETILEADDLAPSDALDLTYAQDP